MLSARLPSATILQHDAPPTPSNPPRVAR